MTEMTDKITLYRRDATNLIITQLRTDKTLWFRLATATGRASRASPIKAATRIDGARKEALAVAIATVMGIHTSLHRRVTDSPDCYCWGERGTLI